MLTIDTATDRAFSSASRTGGRLAAAQTASHEPALESSGKPIDMGDCIQCMSLWAAIPFAFAIDNAFPQWLRAGLAMNSAARELARLGEPQGSDLDGWQRSNTKQSAH